MSTNADGQERTVGVEIEFGSVDALHHQSVDRLGEGLRVVGRDEAGVVQAVETGGDDFLIGVQWHPELLVFSRPQQRLYRALTVAARSWAETGAASLAAADRVAEEMAG